ncbi:MAG: hypothetical protein AAFR50_03250 [Pseudomonadota bacterium]
MTALKDYARLETSGLWRAGADAQRRNVGVAFGDATLVISDASGRPLTHWSLAAIARLNPKDRPALFAPDDSEETETLEIDDEDMIAAIGKVQKAIARARPKSGRLRWAILACTTTTLAWLGVFWLPGALIDHAVRVVPDVARADIGDALLARTARISGQPCTDPFGSVALRRLQNTVAPGTTLHVLQSGLRSTAALPGGHVLIGRGIIEDYEDPMVAAGFVVAELTRTEASDPLRDLLNATGAGAALQLLTSGSIPAGALDSYAETLLTTPPAPLPAEMLLHAFRDHSIPATPYAYALDVTGESTLTLIEADPYAGTAPAPPLSDGEWISLQDICRA